MKIIVTGATGFLGQHLCLRLRKLGFDVTALGRNKEIGAKLKAQDLHFKQISLEDKKAVINSFASHDFVFHCAALSAPWGKKEAFYEANVLGTEHVIQACFQHHIKKLIYVSSPSIYFDFKERASIKEDEPLPKASANAYIASKKEAEKRVDAASQAGLAVVTLRPRGLFGPGDNAILPRILKAIKNNQFPLINHGKAIIDLSYIDNVVDALLLAMHAAPAFNGKKYNITNGQAVNLKDFLTQLFQEMALNVHFRPVKYKGAMIVATLAEYLAKIPPFSHKEPLLTRYGVGVLGLSQTLNIEAAKQDLGYFPKISLEEGIVQVAKWWKNDNR